jgi:OOP family OmpA-OmpF porin
MTPLTKTLAAPAIAALLCTPFVAGAQVGAQTQWGTYVGASVGEPDFGELGVKVFGGQQFHPNIGWEAAFTQFLEDKTPSPFGDTSTEFWGVSGSVVGILPLQNNFSLFGKLGLIYGRERIRRAGVERTEGETNPLLGVGLHYQATSNVGFRAEYEDFDQGNLLSAGITYRF